MGNVCFGKKKKNKEFKKIDKFEEKAKKKETGSKNGSRE